MKPVLHKATNIRGVKRAKPDADADAEGEGDRVVMKKTGQCAGSGRAKAIPEWSTSDRPAQRCGRPDTASGVGIHSQTERLGHPDSARVGGHGPTALYAQRIDIELSQARAQCGGQH